MQLHKESLKKKQACTGFEPLTSAVQIYEFHIQLFRERLSEKNVHATIPKGNMGYDRYIVPDTVAVELTFVAFL